MDKRDDPKKRLRDNTHFDPKPEEAARRNVAPRGHAGYGPPTLTPGGNSRSTAPVARAATPRAPQSTKDQFNVSATPPPANPYAVDWGKIAEYGRKILADRKAQRERDKNKDKDRDRDPER